MEATKHAKSFLNDRINSKPQHYKLEIFDGVISLCDLETKEYAKTQIERALQSEIQSKYHLTDNQLKNSIVLHAPTFSSAHASENMTALLAYFALRQARIMGCEHVINVIDNDPAATEMRKILHLEALLHSPVLYAQKINYALYHAYNHCTQHQRDFIRNHFAHEILDTFHSWVSHLFQESWFTAVKTRTLSKEQYVSTLFNLHAFVKHTTRLAARCVAVCDARELRNHYINHLKGEINHEVIIESDLKGLHADVDYLIHHYVPATATAEFIVLQESIVAFRQDAVMMLACPFVAEGMTANISNRFVTDLHATIQSWGIKSPESVSRFLTSHMKTDGGDDGHWIRVIMMMDKYIHTEQQMQQFLNVLKLAMNGYAHGLNANIDDMGLWQSVTTPVNETV